jgi:hypothetical protein
MGRVQRQSGLTLAGGEPEFRITAEGNTEIFINIAGNRGRIPGKIITGLEHLMGNKT